MILCPWIRVHLFLQADYWARNLLVYLQVPLEFFLEEGDTLEFTQSAIQLESLISQFMFNQGSGGNNGNDTNEDQ